MPTAPSPTTTQSPLDLIKEIWKNTPADKKMHYFGAGILLAILLVLLKVYGLKFAQILVYGCGLLMYAILMKEVYDKGCFDWAVPAEPLSYVVAGGFFLTLVAVAGLLQQQRIGKEAALWIAVPLFSLLVLMIAGPKGHVTGFSIDDIIAGMLGGLTTLGLLAVGFYFWRLVRYFTGKDNPYDAPAP